MKSRHIKRIEAKQRLLAWQSLSVATQLRQLDLRLGVNHGAKRQRERLTREK